MADQLAGICGIRKVDRASLRAASIHTGNENVERHAIRLINKTPRFVRNLSESARFGQPPKFRKVVRRKQHADFIGNATSTVDADRGTSGDRVADSITIQQRHEATHGSLNRIDTLR